MSRGLEFSDDNGGDQKYYAITKSSNLIKQRLLSHKRIKWNVGGCSLRIIAWMMLLNP